MLQFIKDLPAHVVGIHAIGEVTKEDVDRVLIPKIDELVKRQDEINYLLVLETDVQNWSSGAWLDDIKMGIKNFTKWNKIAVLSDQKGVQWFTDAFHYFVPGKSKGFSLNELDEAVKWVSAND
ncbi:STAS/SEC14 domain-containing protein [Mucilaginibacter sp. 44-25]|uniref:STAS/SEC14 domain-containing protein n=1 Tax=Mucilaginibacter sp. 44-25 TaxID=1895794 RepID=UPI00095E42E1|nr:STAS/SEC14 domain-containing protein [Mucilaginibacter sp. 44-25]OJW18122.1 MAG: STAS/SEC14 domain-containing protein [Mucilaginibacter sp. 44-25]